MILRAASSRRDAALQAPPIGERALWEVTAPGGPALPALEGRIDADTAVIGAGVTGLAAALTLAENGAKAVVLEAGAIGSGATGRSSGFVNAGMWIPPERIRASLGANAGEHLLEVLGQAPSLVFHLIRKHGIACDPEPNGTLQCAVGSAGMRAIEESARSWEAMDADVRLLDADATAARLGTSFFSGALLDSRTGTLQPLAYARGLARAALKAGARIFCRSTATKFERKRAKWVISTASGEVCAARVLMTTDAYLIGGHFGLQREFYNLPYFNVATEPLSPALREAILPSRQGLTDTRSVPASLRMDRDGRLVIGSVGALSGWGKGIHARWAAAMIGRLFPHADRLRFESGWFGSVGMTKSHLPAIHAPAPGAIAVGGYNGRGIAAGTVMGQALALHLVGKLAESDLPLPISAPNPVRFRGMRERMIEWGARADHMLAR